MLALAEDRPQRPGPRRQIVAHRHGDLWRPRHPPARRHLPQIECVPNAERIFFIRHALRAGFTIEEIFQLTKIDRWFLVQIKELVDFEEELAASGSRQNDA